MSGRRPWAHDEGVDNGYRGWQDVVPSQDLRCSDAERESVIDRLKDAYADGRLDPDELDMRVHMAVTARTRGDLAVLTTDLVVQYQPVEQQEPTGEDRMLAALAHASGCLTSFVGPLLFLLLSGKRSAYVRRHAAEALNFQLTLLLVTAVTFGFGGLLYLIAWIPAGIAAVAALTKGWYRYPLTLRMVK